MTREENIKGGVAELVENRSGVISGLKSLKPNLEPTAIVQERDEPLGVHDGERH
jgi:hypothetical protein